MNISELLKNLHFTFDTFNKQKINNWPTQRHQYHEVQEQIHDQIVYFTILLQKITPRPIKFAILLPDIYPQKHKVLLSRLTKTLENARQKIDLPIETILKRNNEIIKNTADSTVHEFIDWADPTTLSKFDLVIVLCSNFSLPILSEIMIDQQAYENTVFFCNIYGVKLEKLQNVFRTDLIAMPKLDSVLGQKNNHIQHRIDTNSSENDKLEFSFDCIERLDDIFNFTDIKNVLCSFLIKLGYTEQHSWKLIHEEIDDDLLWVQRMRKDFQTRSEYEHILEVIEKKWE